MDVSFGESSSIAARSAVSRVEPGDGPLFREYDGIFACIECSKVTTNVDVRFATIGLATADLRVGHIFAVGSSRRGVDLKSGRIEAHANSRANASEFVAFVLLLRHLLHFMAVCRVHVASVTAGLTLSQVPRRLAEVAAVD